MECQLASNDDLELRFCKARKTTEELRESLRYIDGHFVEEIPRSRRPSGFLSHRSVELAQIRVQELQI